VQAQAEAARLVAAAHELADDGAQRYINAYTAATAAGWTPTDLTALGFHLATGSTPRRRRSHVPAAEPAGVDLASPTQRHDHELDELQPAGT